MTTTNNITNTGTINIYNNTNQTINPNMYIPTKACNKCRSIKQLTEFREEKSCHDGYRTQCKSGEAEYRKIYYNINKDIYSQKRKEYNEKNKIKESNNRKEYYKQNKIKEAEYQREYYKLNKDKINKRRRDTEKIERNINPIIRLIENNRNRIRKALKSNSKVNNTINLLGCDKKFFYQWIMWQLPHEMDDNEFNPRITKVFSRKTLTNGGSNLTPQ